MRILADLCVHKDLIETLRADRCDISSAAEKGLSKSSDDEIFKYAQKHAYVILSYDKDFGNIVRFDIRKSHGIVLVYVEGMDKHEVLDKTSEFFKRHKNKSLSGHLFLIESEGERTWPQPAS